MSAPTLTEEQAIAALHRLAKRWPSTLRLFSWSGSPCVCRFPQTDGKPEVLATIQGIPNDGGDP